MFPTGLSPIYQLGKLGSGFQQFWFSITKQLAKYTGAHIIFEPGYKHERCLGTEITDVTDLWQ